MFGPTVRAFATMTVMPSERDNPVYLSRKAGDCFLIDKIVVQVDRVTQQIVVFVVEEKRISVRRGHSRRLGDLPIRVTVREISGDTARQIGYGQRGIGPP